jgi:hypothetical protein
MTAGPSPLWYATRATGVMALVLLTAAVVLGVAGTARLATPRWPRVITARLHRNLSLLAVAFVAAHVLTTELDPFAPVGWVSAVVPFASSYRTFWLGLGTVAFDMLLAVVVTSMLRARLGYRAWRAVHWLGYTCWLCVGGQAGQEVVARTRPAVGQLEPKFGAGPLFVPGMRHARPPDRDGRLDGVDAHDDLLVQPGEPEAELAAGRGRAGHDGGPPVPGAIERRDRVEHALACRVDGDLPRIHRGPGAGESALSCRHDLS